MQFFNLIFIIGSFLTLNIVNARCLKKMVDPAACTAVEQDIDYFGNDISNVKGLNTECCQKCRDYPGCRAWTWSDLNGGTCWLKSSSTTKTPKKGVISSVLIDKTPICSFENGIDYIGNDIGNQAGATPSDCCLICKNRVGCGAFTWSDYLKGTCWLKSGRGEVAQKTGVVSSITSYVAATCTNVETGKDYVGNDIGNVPGSDATKCCTACSSFIGCKAWSWSNHNGGTCWLKSSKSIVVDNAAISSWSDTNQPKKCNIETNVDYIDNDIGNVPGTSGDCCDKCKNTPNCNAWSWSNYLGGTCWLKSKKDKTVLTNGITSGYYA